MQPLNYRKIKQLNLKVSNFLTFLVKIILHYNYRKETV